MGNDLTFQFVFDSTSTDDALLLRETISSGSTIASLDFLRQDARGLRCFPSPESPALEKVLSARLGSWTSGRANISPGGAGG